LSSNPAKNNNDLSDTIVRTFQFFVQVIL
jgi:hypothetical protein